MAAPTRKLKILCLHGFRQNSKNFRVKTGAFRSALKKYAEFDIIDAPHQVEPAVDDMNGERQEQRGWWFSQDSEKCPIPDHGLQQSIDVIEKTFKEQGPYDGILGFSQGASFAALLCHMMERGDLAITIQFIFLIAGFNSSSHSTLDKSNPLKTRALCVIGENDTIIPRGMSEDLLDYFMHVETVYHPGGHGLPIRAEQKRAFIKYLQDCAALRMIEETDSIGFCVFMDIDFCDAPHEVGDEQGGGNDGNSRGWWFSREDNFYKAVDFSDIDKGFQESVQAIVTVFQEQGPFDGVLAFSQGGSFLSLLCALKESGDIAISFDFAMFFAAFKSRCSPHDRFYNLERPMQTKVLLGIGEGDEVIPLDMATELIPYFEDPMVVYHTGGHFIANQPDQRKAYSAFLAERQAQLFS